MGFGEWAAYCVSGVSKSGWLQEGRSRGRSEPPWGGARRLARRYFAPVSIATCPSGNCAKRHFTSFEFALLFDETQQARGGPQGHSQDDAAAQAHRAVIQHGALAGRDGPLGLGKAQAKGVWRAARLQRAGGVLLAVAGFGRESGPRGRLASDP